MGVPEETLKEPSQGRSSHVSSVRGSAIFFEPGAKTRKDEHGRKREKGNKENDGCDKTADGRHPNYCRSRGNSTRSANGTSIHIIGSISPALNAAGQCDYHYPLSLSLSIGTEPCFMYLGNDSTR